MSSRPTPPPPFTAEQLAFLQANFRPPNPRARLLSLDHSRTREATALDGPRLSTTASQPG